MALSVGRSSVKHQSDVIVIGAGGSGLAAAVAAAENGAKVIVLEKHSKVGGATVFAEGMVAAESPLQKRANINVTTDDLFKNHMYYSHWTLNARLVRVLIDKSGDTIQWLENKGLAFEIGPTGEKMRVRFAEPPAFLGTMLKPEGWGSGIIKVLKKSCLDLNIPIFYNARARKLLIDKSGSVVGVALNSKQPDIVFNAKSIIIATGGYGGNIRLMQKYCPQYDTRNFNRLMLNHSHAGDRVRWVKNIHSGDGLLMAFEAGAASEGLGTLLLNGPNFVAFNHAWPLALRASTLWVNTNGERFMQEGINPFVSENGVLRQPDQTIFSFFDESYKQENIKIGYGLKGLYNHDAGKIDADLQDALANDTVKISHSWNEIAKWIGTGPEVLKATVAEYNSFCDKGHDDLFAKPGQFLRPLRNPPYYACKCHPGFLVTIGGIKTNHRMEVLDKQDRPIKGLFAAGISIGGWSAPTYNISLAGAGGGMSVYSGRIAGETAAHYAKK
jgi:fumarate reductase flavoprotein subunit